MESRRANALGVTEPKDISKYLGKTKRNCPTCTVHRPLYIKKKQDGVTDLECPVCDNIVSVPTGTE